MWSTTHKSINYSLTRFSMSLNVGIDINYNMTLEYHMENSLGAKICVDPLERFAIRIDDHEIEFR